MAATARSLRRTWFQVHKWIGVVLTIIFIPLSLTGSLLVWDEPLDRMLRPAHFAAWPAPALPASAYVAAARKVLRPGLVVTALAFPKDEPVLVTAAEAKPPRERRGPPQRTGVWLDPATARVIDSGPAASPFVRWVHVFHGSLQIPGWGRPIVGWLGVAMLLSCVSGLWLWWPATGRWVRGLRWGRRREFDANLHHLAGFWIALPLGLLALTGVLISFPVLTGGGGMRGPRPAPAAPLAMPRLDADTALAAALPLGGGAMPAQLQWPTDRAPVWRVRFGEHGPLVEVADAGGAAAPTAPDRDRRTPSLARRLHDGTGMGIVWQVLIFVAGILPLVLGVTGILMWLRSRRWRGDVARRKDARAAA